MLLRLHTITYTFVRQETHLYLPYQSIHGLMLNNLFLTRIEYVVDVFLRRFHKELLGHIHVFSAAMIQYYIFSHSISWQIFDFVHWCLSLLVAATARKKSNPNLKTLPRFSRNITSFSSSMATTNCTYLGNFWIRMKFFLKSLTIVLSRLQITANALHSSC